MKMMTYGKKYDTIWDKVIAAIKKKLTVNMFTMKRS